MDVANGSDVVGSDAFVNKEQWSVIRMMEKYHARFATIMQIIYQREKSAYFSNHIAITFNLENKGKKINYYFIILTQMSKELTQWTEHQKQIVARLATPVKKVATCYFGLVIKVFLCH